MTSRRYEPEHALAEAARAITHATQRLLEETPQAAGGLTHEQLRETGWQLVQLTGRLADTVAALAVRLNEHGSTYPLQTTEGGDPSTELAAAARRLTDLRQALERADTAARDYHTCLSGLTPDSDPTRL